MHIVANLPRDRTQTGTLEVWHDGALVASYLCYAKADNAEAARRGNPERDPLKPFGDTPCGKWKATVGNAQENIATYGPEPVIMLWPLDGQAYASHQPQNRRVGIWIHGGALNEAGGLRPTYGCIRVHNETMAALHTHIRQVGDIEYVETREV